MSYAHNDSWYEPEYENTPAEFGWIHEDDIPDLENCKRMLEVAIEAVYKSGDTNALSVALDELASNLDVEMPKMKMAVEKTKSSRDKHLTRDEFNSNNAFLLKHILTT